MNQIQSKDDFSKMLFFTSTKDGQLLESNIFEKTDPSGC